MKSITFSMLYFISANADNVHVAYFPPNSIINAISKQPTRLRFLFISVEETKTSKCVTKKVLGHISKYWAQLKATKSLTRALYHI